MSNARQHPQSLTTFHSKHEPTMTNMTNPQAAVQSLDEAVALEIGALRLEVIKLRVSVQQTAHQADDRARAKDREISALHMELDRMKETAERMAPAKVIDGVVVDKTATNGASAH